MKDSKLVKLLRSESKNLKGDSVFASPSYYGGKIEIILSLTNCKGLIETEVAKRVADNYRIKFKQNRDSSVAGQDKQVNLKNVLYASVDSSKDDDEVKNTVSKLISANNEWYESVEELARKAVKS